MDSVGGKEGGGRRKEEGRKQGGVGGEEDKFTALISCLFEPFTAIKHVR